MKGRACAVLTFALCACTGPVYEGQYAYDDGWAIGHVAESGAPQSIRERASKDCRLGAIAQGMASHDFARVEYQRGRAYKSIIAIVPAGMKLSAGDSVYVNFQDCFAELVPRHWRR